MMSNTEELQYGECCCCLDKGDHREVTELYYLDKGPEIYEVLFRDTFDIVLKYPEKTKLICEVCIEKLRQARHFRSMVDSTQQSLSERVNWQITDDDTVTPCIVKIERLKYEEEALLEELVLAEGVDINSDNLDVQDVVSYETEDQMEELDSQVDDVITVDHSDETVTPCIVKIERLKYEEEALLEELVLAEGVDINSDNLDVQDVVMYETDNQMEELDSQVDDVITVDHSVLEEAFIQIINTENSKCEVDNEMERRRMLEQLLPEELDINFGSSEPSTSSSDKLAITPHKIKTLKVLLTRSPAVEQLPSYDSDCQYKQLAAPLYEDKRFVCDFCSYKTAYKESMKVHLRNHTREKLFSCDICQYKTARKENLKVHLLTHTGEKQFSCDICQYKTTRKENLKVHLLTHTRDKPFSCDMCQYKSARLEHVKRHLLTHTGEKPFSCDMCQYKSARKGCLDLHLRTHTGEKPFSCDICQYKGARKGDLKVHLRTHNGGKPFSCDICQYKTTKKENLKVHLLIHTRDKPFSCDICQYKGARLEHVKRHLLTHTGEKPFSCDMCRYKSARKACLNMHLRTHTGEKPFSCDICQYRTSRKTDLIRHLLTHNKK